ncbi:MAG: DUF4082 domain-containing protein [Candidatus Bathyarchaeia archaeon]
MTGTITGAQTGITVNPGAAASLSVTGFTNPATAGTAGTITVTAKDAYGNTATGYRGTVKITSSDGAATLPSNHQFTSGNNGVYTFSVTLNTVGTQSITATDTTTSSITGSQTGITVNPPSSGYFGYKTVGSSTYSIEDAIYGSQFTTPAYTVTAQSITAYITVSNTHTVQAAIYTTGGALVASSGSVTVTTTTDGWVTFTLTTPTALTANTNYILVVWANNPSGTSSATISRDSLTGDSRVYDLTFGTWPNSITFTTGNYECSIYCTYTT